MPTPPPPLQLHCPRCHWRGVWAPRSDALNTHDLPPGRCPRCGYPELRAQAASAWEVLLHRSLGWLRRS